jgi:DNA gyrase subunit A
MAKSRTPTSASPPPEDHIVDVDVTTEMEGSFLEYAYSVIYSRALPDARDGLKPVQRRILYQMSEMGLRPDRGHVKSARVVGDVMGRLHPHGDGAIYDALVRMSQSFSLRLPLIDGHGNFGSADDGPAAMRYTECRLAPPALQMTTSIDEDVVDFQDNYDGREQEPVVLPAAIPNLLVNGASGIAVGMATNMAPHNLGEVVAAARYLLEHPNASLEKLVRFVPGPDLPTGGIVVGLDGIRQAYETGRGSFRIRATTRVEQVSARRQGIVVTTLPYGVGPERVIERIRELVLAKKLTGIANLTDLTDADHGMRIVIEIKSGFNPAAVLTQLFRMTPMEDQFSINNVALVEGRPRTLGLKELLQVYLDHRIEVVTRRSQFRRTRATDRLHLVEGLLIAIVDIDEVIAIIRGSDDTAQARHRLIAAFDLTETQVNYILEMPLRRLTKFSRIELESESDELRSTIDALTRVLEDPAELRAVVSRELAEVAALHADDRRTILLESDGAEQLDAAPLEVPDGPCWVLLSNTGLMARTQSDEVPAAEGQRTRHDCVVAAVPANTRGAVGIVTADGLVRRVPVVDLPALPPRSSAPALSGGTPLGALLDIPKPSHVIGLVPFDRIVALGTRQGVVKRVSAEDVPSRSEWELIRLADGDAVVGAAVSTEPEQHLVFITRHAQLLRFTADAVRPQGRAAGGMAGIKLGAGDEVAFFGTLDPDGPGAVVTIAGSDDALPGTTPGSGKVTDAAEYPSKGRATGGVRCHRFRAGEDRLLFAWAGPTPLRASSASGVPIDLPDIDHKRDGTGVALDTPVAGVSGPVG